jgi:hypothetical protein
VAEELFDFFGSAPAIAKLDKSARSRLGYGVRCLSYIRKEHLLPSALLGLGISSGIYFLKCSTVIGQGRDYPLIRCIGARTSACEASVIIGRLVNIRLPIDP